MKHFKSRQVPTAPKQSKYIVREPSNEVEIEVVEEVKPVRQHRRPSKLVQYILGTMIAMNAMGNYGGKE